MNENIEIEIYVDHDTYLAIQQEQQALHEVMQADVYLKDGKTKVNIMVRDRVSVTQSGSCSHAESPSIKVTGPTNKISTPFDIVIPQFTKTGEKPYNGAKTPGIEPTEEPVVVNSDSGKQKYTKETELAKRFVKDNQKILSLLYKGDKNERNQIKLFKQLLNNCDYIVDFNIKNPEQDEKVRKSIKKDK